MTGPVKTKIDSAGLRYMSKPGGSPFAPKDSFSSQTMSCFLCGVRVQGGVLCTLLDAVAGYSGLFVEPGEPAREAVTLGLTTHFIASGEGAAAIATGRVTSRGRRIFFAEAQVALDSGLVVATAMGNFRFVSHAD